MEKMTYTGHEFAGDLDELDHCSLVEQPFSTVLSDYMRHEGVGVDRLAEILGYPADWVQVWIDGDLGPLPSEEMRLISLLDLARSQRAA